MKRDYNILKSYQNEIDMKEKTYKDKKKYNRKVKYKHKIFEWFKVILRFFEYNTINRPPNKG
jgi:hypothetical protein